MNALCSTNDLIDRKIKRYHISNTARCSRFDTNIDTVPKRRAFVLDERSNGFTIVTPMQPMLKEAS